MNNEAQVEAWLRKVHPLSDHIVVMRQRLPTEAEKIPPSHKWFVADDLEAVAKHVVQMDGGRGGAPQNVWVALAAFGERGPRARAQEDVVSLKSFWVDSDARADPGHYQTEHEIIVGMREAVGKLHLPVPSYIVHSGAGFHFYWTLIHSISVPEWLPVAHKLRAALMTSGFKFDVGITIDHARVLRPVGSHNHKYDPPVPVTLLHDGPDLDFQEIKRWSDGIAIAVDNTGVTRRITEDVLVGMLKKAPPGAIGDDPAIAQGMIEGAEKNYLPFNFEVIVEHCPQLHEMDRRRGKDYSEPEWRSALQLISFSANPDEWIHRISDGHDSYDFQSTVSKYNDIVNRRGTFGPHTCSHIEATFQEHPISGSYCNGCPWRGRVKSPATIPFKLRYVGMPGWQNELYPPLGPGLYHRKDDTSDPKRVTRWAFSRYELVEEPEGLGGGSFLRADVLISGGKKVPLQINYKKMPDPRALNNQLIDHGLATIIGPGAIFLLNGLQDMRENLRKEDQAVAETRAMGWGRDKDGQDTFCLGAHVYDATGMRPGLVMVSTDLLALQNAYTPRGGLGEWQKVASILMQDKRDVMHAMVAAAFTGPLVRLIGEDGLIQNFMSPETGVGKTTFMRFAQSVWGSRPELGGVNDTNASTIKKIGMLNSIPVIFDEMRTDKKGEEEQIMMYFRVTTGRERRRMTSSGGMQEALSFRNSMLTSTNGDLYARIETAGMGEPGTARVLQFRVPPFASPLFRNVDLVPLDFNYGVAGEMFVQHLLRNPQQVQTILRTMQADCETLTGGKPEARFLVACGAVDMTAAFIVQRARIIPDIDLDAVRRAVRAAIADAMLVTTRVRLRASPVELVRDYLHEISTQVIKTDRSKRDPVTGEIDILVPPRNDRAVVMAELDVHRKVVYLQAGAFRKFIHGRGLDPAVKIDEMVAARQAGLITDVLAPGTRFASAKRELLMVAQALTGL